MLTHPRKNAKLEKESESRIVDASAQKTAIKVCCNEEFTTNRNGTRYRARIGENKI